MLSILLVTIGTCESPEKGGLGFRALYLVGE